MLDAELFRLTRRVQRVRKQEESGDQLWFGGAEYRRLAATVGVAAEKDPARGTFTQYCNRVVKSGAIAFRIARKRRARAPFLAEGQIAAQDDVAMSGKSFTERHQQRSGAIRARAVGQDQGIAVGVRGRMKETANSGAQ
ncbi:MAG TPA: hypothetical protein VJX69_05235 [Terriglobales bacterium]|nr:hypothetical protein [Terriglobales bacterium]